MIRRSQLPNKLKIIQKNFLLKNLAEYNNIFKEIQLQNWKKLFKFIEKYGIDHNSKKNTNCWKV